MDMEDGGEGVTSDADRQRKCGLGFLKSIDMDLCNDFNQRCLFY